MSINSKQKKHLRALAHNLTPVVMIGNQGASPAVIKEINHTLDAHEMIKIRIRCDNQDEMRLMVDSLTREVKASLVQVIGHSVVLYRKNVSKPGKFTLSLADKQMIPTRLEMVKSLY